ncbi:MAG: L,D-transpeptidase [Candidatus Altimarinota bacterium]
MKFNFKSTVNCLAITLASMSVMSIASAQTVERPLSSLRAQSTDLVEQMIKKVSVSCQVDRTDRAFYNAKFLSIEMPSAVEPDQLFEVKVRMQNTGNTAWFSRASECENINYTYLGTDRDKDRNSPFHAAAVFGNTGWFQGNRINMTTLRANPGEIAEFNFTAKAPSQAGLYREYFSPVIENTTWISPGAEATFDLKVGNPALNEDTLKITRDLGISINLADPKFEGDKKLLVDISEQRLYVQLGGQTIKVFPVSSGTSRTPTPYGTTKISLKQEVRVGSAAPHYIMPKFMMFRNGGYGFHALPSLANDRGVFWREALNHIGTRRSHGCVRLLPDHADFAFAFADVGTTVQIVP